ncbi:hypothetical protein ALC56_06582 [Trachymyrmex septentrionalis]|uniref:Uncharacterized protein n=1 Tax=Trachymyrmex septentrionalis TaxID=34720 RepID=A0A195FFM5_9HYME|nr:hypothetical protein ALC56_06582 [Trachymyrmex septentrionalis]
MLLIHSHARDDERLPGWHDSSVELVTFSHRVINGKKEKEPFDGIRPRPFNEVHEIHKPSRELGHLGYAVTTRQCIIDDKKTGRNPPTTCSTNLQDRARFPALCRLSFHSPPSVSSNSLLGGRLILAVVFLNAVIPIFFLVSSIALRPPIRLYLDFNSAVLLFLVRFFFLNKTRQRALFVKDPTAKFVIGDLQSDLPGETLQFDKQHSILLLIHRMYSRRQYGAITSRQRMILAIAWQRPTASERLRSNTEPCAMKIRECFL